MAGAPVGLVRAIRSGLGGCRGPRLGASSGAALGAYPGAALAWVWRGSARLGHMKFAGVGVGLGGTAAWAVTPDCSGAMRAVGGTSHSGLIHTARAGSRRRPGLGDPPQLTRTAAGRSGSGRSRQPIVPAMMSVLPRLNALIGIPNPIVTKPAAVASRPTTNRTDIHRLSVPYQSRGGHNDYEIVTAFRFIRKNVDSYSRQIYD